MGNSCSLTTVGISGEDGNWTRWKKGYTLMLKVDGVWKIQDGRCLTKNQQPHFLGKATLLKKNSKNHLIEKLTTKNTSE